MLVFQYGSNTSEKRLNSKDRLKGDATPFGAFQTEDTYSLEFTVWSTSNNCAAANIAPNPDRQIWGAVYDVPDHLMSRDTAGDRRSMDAIEGKLYRRERINVLDPSGRLGGRPVVTYVVTQPTTGLKTSLEYVGHILCGLWALDAPADYVTYVTEHAVANNPDLAGGIAALCEEAAGRRTKR